MHDIIFTWQTELDYLKREVDLGILDYISTGSPLWTPTPYPITDPLRWTKTHWSFIRE